MISPLSGFLLDVLLPLVAIAVAIWAYRIARRVPPAAPTASAPCSS